ncbi:MAG: hypothetical protein J1F07_07000 [Muribaculaceae bacterium]|nr:hypothetical protein [Muribaculaceae bacterium]
MGRILKLLCPCAAAGLLLASCHQLNDERIPAMKVNIDLSNQGLWNTYGVHTYGQVNDFILELRLPAGYPYGYNAGTGYGGVMLIYGQNGFTGEVGPLAYDLSCPVERKPDVRVYVDHESLEAVCPECGSRYNVVEAGGTPVADPAKGLHYGLTPYQCYPTTNGGYVITR